MDDIILKKENNVWLSSDWKWKLLPYLPGKVKETAPVGPSLARFKLCERVIFLASGARHHLDGFGEGAFQGPISLAGHRPNGISIGLAILKTEIFILRTGQDL